MATITTNEDQVNELLKSNEMLRRSFASICKLEDLQGFFDSILLEMTTNTGANHSAVFIYRKTEHCLQMISTVHEGTIRDIQQDPVFEPWRQPIPADITPAWQRLSEIKQTVCVDNDNPPPEHWPMAKIWHASQGHKTIFAIPMLLGNEVLGFLGLCFKTDLQSSPVCIAVCETIAQQAAIAYKLKSLTEDTELAAIARERDKVTNERALQLTQTFTVLRRTSAKLTKDFDLKTFLGHVLLEISDQFQADAALLSVYDEAKKTFIDLAHVEAGKLNTINNFSCTKGSAETFIKTLADVKDGVREFDVETETHLLIDCSIDYHLARGHTRLFALPLVLGDQIIGYICVALRTREFLVLHQQELLLALAQQASIAIHLTRLAEKSEYNAILAERNRLAREIHDTLAQGFTAFLVNLKSLRKHATLFSSDVMDTIDTLEKVAEDNLIEARRSVRGLRPRTMDHGSLLDGLQHLIDSIERTGLVNIELIAEDELPTIPEVTEDELIRIAQEAIQNALRYAQGTRISITLRSYESLGIYLSISDDGLGFDHTTTKLGYGLIGMGERAERIGAAITIISEYGCGTQIILTWTPMSANGKKHDS